MNLENIKRYLSTNDISFLIDFDKTIEINKSGKSYYYASYTINLDGVTNFINNLEVDKIYLINALISVNKIIDSPYINLSRQFLITNKSNPYLIHDFLNKKLDQSCEEFGTDNINDNSYYLIFKYKKVEFDYRVMG